MRIAVIDEKRCDPKKCDRLCERVCPRNKLKEPCITIDAFAKIDESLCVGCGICANRCPFDAIKIVNTPEKIGNLIHRHGENKFLLYNMPVPKKGTIIGLVGRNGIGKSTALKVLAKKITPSSEELPTFLKFYLKEEKIISYKPQVLEEINISEIDKELIKIFDIKEKENYSGGERQTMNVALCLSKEADLYLLDEPSSYLDVVSRLKVANVIKDKLKDKEVIIVEHDLAMLDYLADEVYMLYGAPGVYGVTSALYPSLRGINSYLKGYLPAENVRLRREGIRFELGIQENLKLETLVSFSRLEKRQGDFKLSVEGGEIYQKEILGVLGPNSIGKTTFMEILADKIQADKGNLSNKISISYKAQYLHPDYSGLVEEIVPDTKEFKEQIAFPFHLETLYKKSVEDLSGGELQTLAIALCLNRNADLYLLDEPSAFLDIENRLQLTRLIKRIVENKEASAIIVDHDLHLISQISNRIMLFSGKPSKFGKAGITGTYEALNMFLRDFNITFRRDAETGRFRANKLGSQLDTEQKKRREYLSIE